MGMVVDGAQHHWRVENFRVEPPTEAAFRAAYPGARFFSRPVSSVSDGHHVARSKGDCLYVNCRWSLNNDDTSNFHDRFTIAVRAADRVLDIVNRRGADYFRAETQPSSVRSEGEKMLRQPPSSNTQSFIVTRSVP